MYDPEIPAGYQDADIEMLAMLDAADSPDAECVVCGLHAPRNALHTDPNGAPICPFCDGTF